VRVSCLVVVWMLAAPAIAQTDSRAVVEDVRSAYERLDYAAAETLARRALVDHERFTVDQLAELHTLLALTLYTLNEPVEARRQFEAALSLDPALALDPMLVSPKILEFFREVKSGFQPGSGPPSAPLVRYVRVADPRAGAGLRSLAVPGWGQLHKGERAKGAVIAGTWGLAAAGAGTAHLLRRRAHHDYLSATTPDDIAERYRTFDTWHKVRNNLALGAGLLWGYALVDALLVRGDSGPGVRLAPVVVGESAGLGLTVGL
jgi:hypothetical protein